LNVQQILIDTNLLVLFIVGTVSRQYISKHKRLTQFIPEDYDVLLEILNQASSLLITPNTLTETSNLVAYIYEPARTEIFIVFQQFLNNWREIYIPSTTVSARQEFIRLGLADAAMLEALSKDMLLLTTDLDLYLVASSLGFSAVNFNQIRDRYL
jgi:hypothetical protein